LEGLTGSSYPRHFLVERDFPTVTETAQVLMASSRQLGVLMPAMSSYAEDIAHFVDWIK
jgi:hypothetical protein